MTTKQTEVPFGDRAHARTSDPETSKVVAANIAPAKRTALQLRILRAFEIMGPMHDAALYEVVTQMERNLGLKPSSPSGVRSRRSELAKPNMERLDEIAIARHIEMGAVQRRAFGAFAELSTADQRAARNRLVAEGVRSPLWDTGKRELVDGQRVIVWGLAK